MSGGPVISPLGTEVDSEWLLVGIVFEKHGDGYLVATTLEQVFRDLYEFDKKMSEQGVPAKTDRAGG